MKIAYISTYPPEFCGIGAYMHDFLNSIKSELDDYMVISTYINKSVDDMKIIRLLNPRNPITIFKALLKIKEFDPDVVHVQYVSTLFQPWMPILMNMIKYPMLVESHEVLVYKRSRLNRLRKIALLYYEKVAYRNVNKIIVHNKLMHDRLIKYYNIFPEKIGVVGLGVDTEVDYKKDYSLNNKLLFFGFIHFDKGIDTLIDAFKIIQKKIPNIELILMGGSRSDDAIRYIEDMREKHKLNITMTGYVEDIGVFMRQADILIIPHKELSSHSLAITEAMPYGMPIVASNVGGLRCQIENGVTGKLFEVDSSVNLANVVLDLLSDDAKREELGKNARTYSETELSWKHVCNKIMHEYEEVC